MRLITILLLLAVCFFSGVMYGTFEKSNSNDEITIEEPVITTTPLEIEEEMNELEVIHMEEQDYLVNKTASLFEKVVSSTYEVVITIMYKIASLFFQ